MRFTRVWPTVSSNAWERQLLLLLSLLLHPNGNCPTSNTHTTQLLLYSHSFAATSNIRLPFASSARNARITTDANANDLPAKRKEETWDLLFEFLLNVKKFSLVWWVVLLAQQQQQQLLAPLNRVLRSTVAKYPPFSKLNEKSMIRRAAATTTMDASEQYNGRIRIILFISPSLMEEVWIISCVCSILMRATAVGVGLGLGLEVAADLRLPGEPWILNVACKLHSS